MAQGHPYPYAGPPPQGPWIPSAGAPPGAPPGYADNRFATIGTVCIVLAGCQLAWFLYTIVSSALGMLALDVGSSWLGSSAPAVMPKEMKDFVDVTRDFMRTAAIWTVVRSIPFAALSCVLIHIGLRLRSGSRDALMSARTWMWWAFGALLVSVLLQAFITIPAGLDFQRQMSARMQTWPGVRSPPTSAGRMDTWNAAWIVLGPIAGVVLMAAWPIALRLWADKLLERTAPAVDEVPTPARW